MQSIYEHTGTQTVCQHCMVLKMPYVKMIANLGDSNLVEASYDKVNNPMHFFPSNLVILSVMLVLALILMW